MAFHLFRTSEVAKELAAGAVSVRDQAAYLIVSFLAWSVPFYLYVIPAPASQEPTFLGWMWLVEATLVIAVFVVGVHYCLRRCRVDPKRHFLIDFSCLYAPVSVSTSIVVWGAFHLLALPAWYPSANVYDVVRLFFFVAAILVIFWRVGAHMNRISELRQATSGAPAR